MDRYVIIAVSLGCMVAPAPAFVGIFGLAYILATIDV